MKQTLILLLLFCCVGVHAQRQVWGTVGDGRHPLAGANVFVRGRGEGSITDSLGRFSFLTQAPDSAQLMVSLLGYDSYLCTLGNQSGPLTIELQERMASIGEVVVGATSFHFGQANGLRQLGPLDVVLDGGSCGDIVAALQSLPGTQRVGEDGRLYVRGGSSEECQTYINGMHVLHPYTTQAPDSPSRGRFSPFLFKGIHFSVGGYDAEYGQALSAVLPMETTDASPADKLGLSASLIDWAAGGTLATRAGSGSMNVSYTDLGPYQSLFPDRRTWQSPYRRLSGEAQWKTSDAASGVWKTYLGFDRTTLALDTDGRLLDLGEHNLYLNSVASGTTRGAVSWFAGVAAGMVWQRIDGAQAAGDRFRQRMGELHLKLKVSRILTPDVKGTLGLETFFRHTGLRYRQSEPYRFRTDHQLPALFAMSQSRLFRGCVGEASLRVEYSTRSRRWQWMPRVLLLYAPASHWRLTLSAGRYAQEAVDTVLARGAGAMGPATAVHTTAGRQGSFGQTTVRLEAYHKSYSHLPLLRGGRYTAAGHGMSRGFDLYVDDRSLLPALSTTLSYSYNDARRLYLDYLVAQRPQYASRHNLCLTLRYGIGICYFGLTGSFASGRRSEGRTTPSYRQLDASISCLPSRRITLYASLSNLLGRTHVYGYRQGRPITPASDRFFYFGIFVSLKNHQAYEISNF